MTSSVALTPACAALVASFLVDVAADVIALVVHGVAVACFGLPSRHHPVAKAPEEEFAALAAAEAALDRGRGPGRPARPGGLLSGTTPAREEYGPWTSHR